MALYFCDLCNTRICPMPLTVACSERQLRRLALNLKTFSVKAVALTTCLAMSGVVLAKDAEMEDPSAVAMALDLVFVRPVMLGVTVLGTAAFLVALPFSAAGGNIKQSANTLVVGPGETTFVRCLGCTSNGYQHDVE